MSKSRSQQSWQFLTEDVEAILEGSRQVGSDHIYPADPTLFDRFLVYLGEAGVREALDQLPDPAAPAADVPGRRRNTGRRCSAHHRCAPKLPAVSWRYPSQPPGQVLKYSSASAELSERPGRAAKQVGGETARSGD